MGKNTLLTAELNLGALTILRNAEFTNMWAEKKIRGLIVWKQIMGKKAGIEVALSHAKKERAESQHQVMKQHLDYRPNIWK